jgi:hypothetical protein
LSRVEAVPIAAIIQVTLAGMALWGSQAGVVHLHWGAIAALVLLISGVLVAPRRPSLRFATAGMASTAVPLLMLLAAGAHASATYRAANGMVELGLAWSAVLPFWGADAGRLTQLFRRATSREIIAAILVLSLVAFSIQLALGHPFAFVIDENLYRLQAAQLLRNVRGWPIPEGLEPFFRVRQTFVRGGLLQGQYPPTWPTMLAASRVLKLEGLVPLALYVLSLSCVAGVARSLGAAWSTTLLAVVLTGASSSHFLETVSYFSHGASSALALSAALCAITASRRAEEGNVARWVAAGLLIGLLGATRPLTGVVAVLVVGWWMVTARSLTPRSTVALALGAAAPAIALLWYNRVTTGSFLRFGYDLAHDGLQTMGFGPRGEIWFDPSGMPVAHVDDFTAFVALRQLLATLGEATVRYWPGALIFIIAALILDRGDKIRFSRLLPFLLLPIAYAFYFYADARFYAEAFPFAMIGTAMVSERLARADRRLTQAVIWVTVAMSVAVSAGQLTRQVTIDRSKLPYFHAVEAQQAASGPLLVFVAQPRPAGQGAAERGLEALYWYNSERSGDVIVGRDVASLRSRVMQQFPGRTPIRLVTGQEESGGAWAPPRVERLSIP